jgi:transposase
LQAVNLVLRNQKKPQLKGKPLNAKQVISMSLKEQNQIGIFQKLQDEVITREQAANALGLSLRQVYRKIKSFLKEGAPSLAHKSRVKAGNRSIKAAIAHQAIEVIKERYSDFGPTLAAEMLAEKHDINVNAETLRLLMIKEGVWQKKSRKIKSRRWRKRKSCYGALVQLDGSRHDWFEGRREWCTLLVFIDDATSELVWLEFTKSDSLEGIMKATKNYFKAHGKPVCFYTDFGCVFSVNTNNPERDKKTQFERALAELNVGILHATSPQAKGRVERSNKTHQDRLVKMMRDENISTIDEANAYLQSIYIPKHNKKFAVAAENAINMHQPINNYDLDNILCIKNQRVLANDHTITYKSRYYQLNIDQKTILFPKNNITVHEHINGDIRLFIRKIELNFTELPMKPKKQNDERIIKEPIVVKPASNHPWRTKIKHRTTYPAPQKAPELLL